MAKSNYTPEQIASYSAEELSRSFTITNEDGSIAYLFIPSALQMEIMADATPNLFLWGNRGGGKSVCIRWLCHMLAMAVPGFKYAILRTSFPELQKNHLIYLDEEMAQFGDKQTSYFHKTEHTCYYPNGSKGFYAQCEHDKDVKNVLGAEVAFVFFDESPTFAWEHMRLIVASIRVPKGSGLIPMARYGGNPVGESIDELWKYFIDKDVSPDEDPEYRPEDWKAIEIRLQDNPFLDEAQYRKQFAGLPEHYRKAWLDGVRVEERTLFNLKPRVMRDGESRPYHVIDELPVLGNGTPLIQMVPSQNLASTDIFAQEYSIPPWVQIYRAYDHGYFPDPAVCLWFAVMGQRIICFKEKVWYRTICEDIAVDILAESAGMRVVTTQCDPSIDIRTGADIYTIRERMENKGLPLDPSINNRQMFASSIHSGLHEEIDGMPRLQMYSRGCPYLIKYLPRMKWNENNPAAMADHKHDHAIVCLAYFLMSHIPVTKEMAQVSTRTWMKTKKPLKRR